MLTETLLPVILASLVTLSPVRHGDVTFDGVVDYDDVIEHLFVWGPCEGVFCPADVNRDDVVDVLDFLELLKNLDRPALLVDARTTRRSF